MDRDEAARTLEEVRRVRTETRRRLDSSWYPRLVLGIFLAGFGVLTALEPSDPVSYAYWIGGLVIAITAIVVHYGRAENRQGLLSRAWDGSMTLLVVLIAALVVANRLAEGEQIAVVIPLVAAAATAGFAWLERDPIVAVAAVAMALLGFAYGVIGVDEPQIWVNGGLGVILLASGIAGRRRERSRAPAGYPSGAARA